MLSTIDLQTEKGDSLIDITAQVRAAVESGALDAGRYDQWLQLQRESARAERSVHEQRRFERVFGRVVKRFYKERDS